LQSIAAVIFAIFAHKQTHKKGIALSNNPEIRIRKHATWAIRPSTALNPQK
jgi:hypothetical protein